MFKKSRVSTAVLTVLGGMAVLTVAPATVFAQTVAAPEASETITVTGSRIRTLSSSAPITEVGSVDIALSGATRVEDLLNTLPQLSPGFDSFTVNPTTGFATIDLRGLGSARTLVLVNGHRLQPGGIRSEARDINQIPAALIKRVDILTGGASAVYGADAVAGVVNFVLDTEFEGFSGKVGWSAYQHKNRNSYIQGLMDNSGFSYPTGGSGLDGEAVNVDLAWGSSFADGKGHAMAYFTWRQNEELRQGARDYSSCALNASGTACGGSGTAPTPNFYIWDYGTDPTNRYRGWAHLNADGTWARGIGSLYNYAPINHYQRPDERWTFGNSLKYEVNKHFRPYVETMFTNTNTSVQIAESGTFLANNPVFEGGCANPVLGSICADLGLDSSLNDFEVYVAKRNVEGGPRVSRLESSSFRVVAGTEGELFGNWSYNVSFLYGRNSSSEVNINDFVTSELDAALRCTPTGEATTCTPAYNVWVPGGVTAEAAAALAGVGTQIGVTSLEVFNAYVTGDTGITVPTAADPISLVIGYESRAEKYTVVADTNMQTGNFTGLGGPRMGVDGRISVDEIFAEAQVPLFKSNGFLRALDGDFGYRHSKYNTSGGVDTWKIGAMAAFAGGVRVRGGFNRAIRSPQTGDLFSGNQIALWGGDDPCAGETPAFTAAQCALTGVTADQYGEISSSPASQYNHYIGGNPDLKPEQADTWTLGLVVTPIRGLTLTLDYWNIEITDRIGTIGASTILQGCATTGNPVLCSKVRRNSNTGDLWLGSNLASSGYIENTTANFGDQQWTGLDLGATYQFPLLGGRATAQFNGTQVLKNWNSPLPGVNDAAAYDCAGVINTSCQQPEWKHVVQLRYEKDWWTANVRWRHVGEQKYRNNDGTAITTGDTLLIQNGNKLDAWNYIDLSGSISIGKSTKLTMGVNNLADKEPPMVGSTLVLNANSIGGYDQIGRYFFANVSVKF